jgi:hypothetical protein
LSSTNFGPTRVMIMPAGGRGDVSEVGLHATAAPSRPRPTSPDVSDLKHISYGGRGRHDRDGRGDAAGAEESAAWATPSSTQLSDERRREPGPAAVCWPTLCEWSGPWTRVRSPLRSPSQCTKSRHRGCHQRSAWVRSPRFQFGCWRVATGDGRDDRGHCRRPWNSFHPNQIRTRR